MYTISIEQCESSRGSVYGQGKGCGRGRGHVHGTHNIDISKFVDGTETYVPKEVWG